VSKEVGFAQAIVIAIIGFLAASLIFDGWPSIFAGLALYLACLTCVTLVIVRAAQRRFKTARIWGVASLVAFVLMLLALFFAALPDVAERVEESITISMLKNGANEDAFQRWFRNVGAVWQMGKGLQSDVGYGAGTSPCNDRTEDCLETMQVRFTHGAGMCVIWGDRITMHFTKQRKLKTWSVEPAADGC